MALNKKNVSKIQMYDLLLTINQEAFEGGQFNAAYHALGAALHCAQDDANIEQLLRVEQIAVEQMRWIDLHSPAYEHSTESAKLRGHTGIFHLLAKQARTRVRILRPDHPRPSPQTDPL